MLCVIIDIEEMVFMKTANYNIRLNPDIKAKAERIFAAFGLNLSEAINIFLHKSIMEHGLPFEVRGKPQITEAQKSKGHIGAAFGCLQKYADASLISKENGAWEMAVMEKHADY